MDIKQAITEVVEGRDLAVDDAADVMRQIMGGEATEAQFGSFVTGLRMKGETAEEIAGMARSMRDVSLHVNFDGRSVDTCGTGGDGQKTFNISTTAAFVVAGAGAVVAKHGNRAMSSSSGSADALEALGVKIDLGPDGVQKCLEQVGIGFMFAQAFHPAMKYAGPLRPQIGIRTVFNLLGPLTNPAGAQHQVIGMGDPSAAEKVAQALSILGTTGALVVYAEDGMDEISPEGRSHVFQITDGQVSERTVEASDFGLPAQKRSDLTANTVEESIGLIRGVLEGKNSSNVEQAARTVVVMNTAAALVAVGQADTLQQGAEQAAESIESGRALAKLEALAALSQELDG
ncbi:MAG: anthranilate phosphoribosyltransferase [Chloroflexi bacterium]|jgi:anthranilate phosphoribosyltransferase|nr:anthranilate phosphoribosyltransferase [Chloroflexota bacterium]MBT4072539.1 anthranilate phosphoribosyltransferase [Chloroflexota bacterium]MBT5320368.1 anthranilate phosphoribosyltransferase [Chloroflexota bacterium]MBT6682182.1 anthranilate phosphoribosyltransferase [Chloroflexota bacterium]